MLQYKWEKLMRQLCFILMMLIAGTGLAAGLQQLFDSINKKPAPQPPAPQAPQPPKPPVKK
jgi:hypothetical protein